MVKPESVEIAELQDFKREMAERLSTRSTKEVLDEILSQQVGPEVIFEAQRSNYLNIVKEMLQRGLLTCPECGRSHFSCSHCGREL